MSKRKIPCFCDNEIEVDIPEEVDLAAAPEVEQQILDGTFLSFRCDKCGKVLKPEFPLHVLDSRRSIEIYLLPELERGTFERGKAEYELRDRLHGRVTIGYPELVEKLKLERDGLDDGVVEAIKFYLLQKAEAEDSVRVYYYGATEEAIELHVYGLREEEVGVSKVPRRIYDQIAHDIESGSIEEPLDAILEPPYVSIQKTYREAAE